MLAGERIIRVFVMVEHDFFPAGLTVTVFTLLAIPAGVHIIQHMAIDAFCRSPLVALTRMTAIACDFIVLATQLEIRLVMIEILFFPAFLFVTVLTFLAQVTLVNVIVLVTVVTYGRRFPILFVLLVAQGAFNPDMAAFQLIVRHVVIEGLLAELHNIRITTQVVLVTGTALRITQATQAMKSALRLDVISHIFMTVKTKRILTFLAEWTMALSALLLILGMALDKLAGHYQRLDIYCQCRPSSAKHDCYQAHPNSYKLFLPESAHH